MGGLSGGAMLLRHLRAGVLAERSVCDVRNQHQRSQRVFKPVFQPENCAYRALAYTAVAVLLWTRLRPVYIPKPWRYVVSFALLYGLILHPIAMNTFIKNKPFEKTLDNLASRMEPAAPWQFLTGYYQYRQQLNSLQSY